MRTSGLLGMVGSGGGSTQPPSLLHDVFNQHLRGQLSKRDYEIQNAAWVALNLHEYPVERYAFMTSPVRKYIEARLSNAAEYAPGMCRALSDWLHSVFKSKEENDHNASLVLWCEERCSSVGLSDASQKLLKAIDRLNAHPFPFEDFERAGWVLRKDSIARESGRTA